MTTSPSPILNLRQVVEGGVRPFLAHPQVDRYFPAAAIEDARRRMTSAIDRGDGPALVVGPAGTGKSLLLSVLAAQFQDRFDVVLLGWARLCTRRALLQAILFELGLPHRSRDEGELRLSLLDHLLSAKEAPSELLLLIDEAHTFPVSLLDELRVLTNLVQGGRPRVRLVLAGSLALEESFASPELESFSQRLAARCYLKPFTRDETARYVQAQLSACGAVADALVDAEALEAVFDATDGVPRLVNQLCDRAIAMAAAKNDARLSRPAIQAAWSDWQQLPVPWEAPASAAETSSSVIEFGQLDEDEPAQQTIEEIVKGIETVPAEATDPVPPEATEQETAESAERAAVESPEPANDESGPARPASSATTDPGNPFAEPFEEEEFVLDNFAVWDQMSSSGAPRVENHQEADFSTMVQAALDAAEAKQSLSTTGGIAEQPPSEIETTTESSPPPPDAPEVEEFDHESVNIDGWEVTEVDPQSDAQRPDEANAHWPPIRLAIMDEADPSPEAAGPMPAEAERHTTDQDEPAEVELAAEAEPILIVEADPADQSMQITHAPVQPQVERHDYRHLFSRLRSGVS